MARDAVRQQNKQDLIRVLNNKNISYSDVELCRNINLRYVARRQPYGHIYRTSPVWELPNSVSLVWNLQTLIIEGDHSDPVVVASTEFWKMRHLRHVECHRIYVPGCDGGERLILENLQTLKTAVNMSMSEEVCKSIPNIKKLYLLYDPKSHGYDDCFVENLCNLGRLDKLQSLSLIIESLTWRVPDKQLNVKLRFPSSLNKLHLVGCQLEWEDVTETVGSLPQLQVLMLEKHSVRGREWSPVDGQFQHLKFLKITSWKLKHWNADQSNFPVLKKLLLRAMYMLREIPEGIGDIPTLELIRVVDCSKSAAISAIKIKEVQLDNGNDSLQIQVRICQSEVEDFKKRVESEGLSISNIQFEIA